LKTNYFIEGCTKLMPVSISQTTGFGASLRRKHCFAAKLLAGILPLVGIMAIHSQAVANSVGGVKALIRPVSSQVPLGQPVLVRFAIENGSSESITLTVPGTEPEIPPPEMGLPLAHVFSGGTLPSITVSSDSGRKIEEPIGFRPPLRCPILLISPYSIVGTQLDLREYYPVLRGAGQYRITWQPYGGALSSEPVIINISPLKQTEIITDDGVMTMRLHYEDAPVHVANFLELAKSGFYTGKTFHRIEPGYMIQGGCPKGDGTGIRLDGKRIPAEINGHRHQKGSVSMALLEDDPTTGSCQFFICYSEQRDWDGRYTVFAQLVGEDSFAVLDKIMATPVDEAGTPVRPVVIRMIRINDAPVDALSSTP
jgi:peptidyl-prolyl cis-trans isomerase B (cyclophilin B)